MKKPDKGHKRPRPQVASRFTYNVSSVIRQTKLLSAVIENEFVNKTPRGKKFDRLVSLFWECLPGNLDVQKLEDSLRDLAGTLMTRELIRDVCWRMVGNLQRLRRNLAVP